MESVQLLAMIQSSTAIGICSVSDDKATMSKLG